MQLHIWWMFSVINSVYNIFLSLNCLQEDNNGTLSVKKYPGKLRTNS